HKPLYGCQEFGVGPRLCKCLPAGPFGHIDEAQLGVLGQRLVHAGPDEPWLAGHDPRIILPTPQESLRLVRRHSKRVYQCNGFNHWGFAERDLVAQVIPPSGSLRRRRPQRMSANQMIPVGAAGYITIWITAS